MAVQGLAAAKAAFRQLEPTLRANLADAAEQTAQMIAFKARQTVRHRTGTLAAHIQYTVNRRSGVAKVGIGPRETIALAGHLGTEAPTHIAHLIEFGHGGPHPAEAFAFMLPAAESERQPYLDRCREAGGKTEHQIAATGGGLL